MARQVEHPNFFVNLQKILGVFEVETTYKHRKDVCVVLDDGEHDEDNYTLYFLPIRQGLFY